MKYSHFKQIKLCLHCNNNEEEEGSNDYLFKGRLLLNTLKTTLWLYLNVGDEVALDKSNGFNPHLEEKDHGNAVNDDNENACRSVDENSKEDNIDEHNPNTDQSVSKTTSLILDMVKPFFGSGRTLTRDNYYGGADALVESKKKGIYAQCTYHQNQKHCCPFANMTTKDVKQNKQGSYKVAVN
eukprot:13275546-Ditylum_brightwellii.AAC.1